MFRMFSPTDWLQAAFSSSKKCLFVYMSAVKNQVADKTCCIFVFSVSCYYCRPNRL